VLVPTNNFYDIIFLYLLYFLIAVALINVAISPITKMAAVAKNGISFKNKEVRNR